MTHKYRFYARAWKYHLLAKKTFQKRKFKNKNDLQRHNRIHKGEKPFLCEVCKVTFRRKWDLQRHEKTHFNEKQKLYKCKFCNKKYSLKRSLTRHMKVHDDSKGVCLKIFGSKYHLKRHCKQHPIRELSDSDEYPSKWIRNCPRYLKGREYVECIQARIASLKTPSRIARGERAHLGKQCRYCKWKVH